MKIINLFGGPGSGKSTTAAGLFHAMKCQGLNVELVTEYAKDMVWEQRWNVLEDQLYIFAKQHRRIERLADQGLDWVVTDSPTPIGLVYQKKPNRLGEHFPHLVMDLFNQHANHNFLLKRTFAYNPIGRNQKDINEAAIFDNRIETLIADWRIPVTCLESGPDCIGEILKNIGLTE